MTPVIYEKQSEEKLCSICLSAFEGNQRLTKLACNCLFHENCFPEYYMRCPYCLHEFFVFENNLNELVQAVEELFENVFGLTKILKRYQVVAARAWLINEVITFYSDAKVNPSQTAKELIEINRSWNASTPRTPEELQSLTLRHADFLAKFCDRHLYTKPVALNHGIFMSDVEEAINDLKEINDQAPDQEKAMFEYGITLLEKFAQNEKVKNLFIKKEHEFIRLTQEELRVSENNQRLRHIYQLDLKQRSVIASIPEAQISGWAMAWSYLTFWK